MSCVGVILLTNKPLFPSYIADGLFAVLVFSFISVKLIFFLRGVDILSYPERHICYVLFGGVVDDFHSWYEAWSTPEPEEPAGGRQRHRSAGGTNTAHPQ